MKPIILVVEDEIEIARLIQQLIEKEGFSCQISVDGMDALNLAQTLKPDVIVLDLMLPGLDGLEVCNRIRQQTNTKDPYILMLTAKSEEMDRVIGLSTGADDYLSKPFSPRELVARIRALLRRNLRQEGQPQLLRTQHFSLSLEQHSVYRYSEEEPPLLLELAPLEFKLLQALMSYPGRAWSRSQLIEKLWGDDFYGDERVVDTQITRLRKKTEPNPGQPIFIKTVVGVGYKFEDEPE